MELWVVAQILGLHKSDDRLVTEAEQRRRDADINRQRVLAADGQAPPPDFEPTGPIIDEASADDMLARLRAARAERNAARQGA